MLPVVLAVGDTTYLLSRLLPKDGYGPIGNGGNGLILHTNLAVEPLQDSRWVYCGRNSGIEAKAKPPMNETPSRKVVLAP